MEVAVPIDEPRSGLFLSKVRTTYLRIRSSRAQEWDGEQATAYSIQGT